MGFNSIYMQLSFLAEATVFSFGTISSFIIVIMFIHSCCPGSNSSNLLTIIVVHRRSTSYLCNYSKKCLISRLIYSYSRICQLFKSQQSIIINIINTFSNTTSQRSFSLNFAFDLANVSFRFPSSQTLPLDIHLDEANTILATTR